MSDSAEKAYREIYRRICNGQLVPGARLVERQLCAELAVSRTPVREALRRLTAEGLVESRPRRGVVVSQLSPQELREVFEVGVVLESFCASLAARNAGGQPIPALRVLVDEMALALASESPDVPAYIELDHRFHLTVAQLTGNQRVLGLLKSTTDLRVLSQAFSHYDVSQLQRSLRQHVTLLEAIETGDEDWAASAMRAHILSGRAISGGADPRN